MLHIQWLTITFVLLNSDRFHYCYLHAFVPSSVRGVYVLETADHSAQTAVTVTDMQQHQQLLQHQVQQVQQVQPGQQDQQVQQVSIPQFHPQAQPQQQFHHQQAQAQAYYNNVPMPAQVQGNGLALVDTGVHIPPGQNMQVAGNA